MVAFTDNFTGVENSLLKDRTGWTYKTGGANNRVDIKSNQCHCNWSDVTLSYWCTDQGSADCYTQYVVKTASSWNTPACLRMTESGGVPSYIGVGTMGSPAVVRIRKNTAGTITTLGSLGTTTVSVNDTVRIEASGTSIKALLNGSDEVIGITETLNSTVTQQGSAPFSSGLYFDDFEAGVLAAGVTTYYQTISAVTANVATSSEVPTFVKALSATATASATLSKVATFYRGISVTATAAASTVKKMFKTVSVTSTVTASVSGTPLILQAISATATATATVTASFIAGIGFIRGILRSVLRGILQTVLRGDDQ